MTTLALPYGISANRYWRTVVNGKRAMMVPTTEAKAFKARVQRIALAAGLRTPITGWVALDMTLHPPEPKDAADRVRRLGPSWHMGCRCIDVDNAIKVTVDALQGVAYVNDSQVVGLTIRRGLPVPNGGLTVVITEPRIEDVEQSPQGVLPMPAPIVSREAQAVSRNSPVVSAEPLAF